MRKTVVPRSSRRPRMCSHRLARACGSRPVVGSSRKTSSGHVDQADGDVEPAPLAAGQRLGLPLPQPVEVELAEQLLAALGRLGRAHPVQPGVVDDLLAGPGVGVGGAALRDVADPAAHADRVGDQVAAGDRGGAGGGLEQRGQHAQRRRLAGAVGAEEADDLPGLDVEVDADDGVDLLLRLRKVRASPRAWITRDSIAQGTDRSRASSPGRSHRCRSSPGPVGARAGRSTVSRAVRPGPARTVGGTAGIAPAIAAGRADGAAAARPAPRAPGRAAPATAATGRRARAGRRAGGAASQAAVQRPSSAGRPRVAARHGSGGPQLGGHGPRASAARRAAGRSGRRPAGRPGRRGQPAGQQVEALDVGGDVGPPQRVGEEADLLGGPLGADQRPALQVGATTSSASAPRSCSRIAASWRTRFSGAAAAATRSARWPSKRSPRSPRISAAHGPQPSPIEACDAEVGQPLGHQALGGVDQEDVCSVRSARSTRPRSLRQCSVWWPG